MASKRTRRPRSPKRPQPRPDKRELADEKDDEKPKPRQLLLRVPDELHGSLRHLAIDRRKSVNAMLLEVIEQWHKAQQKG